jgi:hypothetical protein
MAQPWEEDYESAPVAKKPARSVQPSAAPAVAATPAPVFKTTTPDDFGAEFEKEKAALKKTAEERTAELPAASPMINEGVLLSPPAMVGVGSAVGAAAMYGGSKALPMVKRWLSGKDASPSFSPNALEEPPMFGSPAQRQQMDIADPQMFRQTPAQPVVDFEPPMSRPAAPSQNLTLEEARARLARVAPAASVAPPVAPVAPVEAAAPAMVEAPKPVAPSPAPNSPVTQAVSETIKDMVQAEDVAAMPSRPVTPTPAAALPVAPPTGELKTGSGLTAYPGQGKPKERFPKEFKTVADIPAGYAFVPGMGPGTNVIRNTYTPEGYNALIQERQVPFGSDVETRAFMKQYDEQRVGPPASRELRKSLGLPMPQNTTGVPMRKAVVGGIAGAVLAIPDLANAAQNRDVGQAAEVGSGFLPPALQALIYAKGAGEGEAAELDRQRRMQAYALQAGRGVAQGYDPRRLVGVAPPMR